MHDVYRLNFLISLPFELRVAQLYLKNQYIFLMILMLFFYQNAYDQLGIGFGDGGVYMTRIQDATEQSSLYLTAVDEVTDNANIVLAPKGTGTVRVTGQFTINDGSFILEDAQGPKARFEIGNIGAGSTTRIFTLPQISIGQGTTVVGEDTTQTLRNFL